MASDSCFSYLHMDGHASVLFVESWDTKKLRWDDIDIATEIDQHENLLEQFLSPNEGNEDELGTMGANGPIFNSSYANRMKQKNMKLNWKDVNLEGFQPSLPNEYHDYTILKRPNLDNVDYDEQLDSFLGQGNKNDDSLRILEGLDRPVRAGENLNTEMEMGMEMEMEMEMDIDGNPDLEHSTYPILRNVPTGDLSRSFSQQIHTPVINNRVYFHEFPGGSVRKVSSQQRRQTTDTSNTSNINYHTPRHDNIR